MTELLPSHLLYKYMSPQMAGLDRLEHIKQILVDDTIYYPRPSQLNDRNDCRPVILAPTGAELIGHITRVGRTRLEGSPAPERRQRRRQVRKRLMNHDLLMALWEDHAEHRGVYSLGATCTNSHLWREYSDGLQGVCIAFDWKRCLGDLDTHPMRVTYQRQRPSIRAMEIYEPESRTQTVAKLLCTKTLKWSAEDEWRLLLDIESNGGQKKKLPDGCITGVIFGERLQDSDREQVTAWAVSRLKPLEIRTAFETPSGIEIR